LEGVAVEQILLGNGSHEILMQLGQVFAGPGDDVVMSRYGFAVYALAAQCAGARCVIAEAFPSDHAMPLGHDPAALAAAVTPSTKLLYLANPNNPTGTWMSLAALRALLDSVPGSVIVVVDEAYLEYRDEPAGGSAASLLASYDNLVVTRTFSKAHGLAGLRIGYALAHAELIAVLERVRESFNVNMLGLAAAEAALGDVGHLDRVRAVNAQQRQALGDELARRGHVCLPSQTNFLLVHFGAECARVEQHLLAQGVVPRPMRGYGLPDHLRITVALEQDNQRLLDAVDSWSAR
jgi:histidinol-phosphate aminotransferase